MNWLEWCGVALLAGIGVFSAAVVYALAGMSHRAAVQVRRHWVYIFRDWPREGRLPIWKICKWALRDWWRELFASYSSQTIANVTFPYNVREPVIVERED